MVYEPQTSRLSFASPTSLDAVAAHWVQAIAWTRMINFISQVHKSTSCTLYRSSLTLDSPGATCRTTALSVEYYY